MDKIKEIRKFLNPYKLECPGAIRVSPYYNKGKFHNVTLHIGDCARSVNLEFQADDNYSSITERKRDLKNSIAKADILLKAITEIRDALVATTLELNEQDERNKRKKKKNEKTA